MKLSPRQTEIVDQLASGKCAKEVAAALGITVTTVEKLLATARRRNKCRTTVQLIADRHRADVEERDQRLAWLVGVIWERKYRWIPWPFLLQKDAERACAELNIRFPVCSSPDDRKAFLDSAGGTDGVKRLLAECMAW